ncbi:MAG: efflux RND transporter periplasmic adaptor subunit [Bacteroidia bacterium]
MKSKFKVKSVTVNVIFSLWLLALGFGLLSCNNKPKEILTENEYYACSMDPQVLEKQAGLCPICKMPLAKVTLDKNQMHIIKLNAEQIKLANIKVDTVKLSSIGKETVLSGVFAVNQSQTEQIATRINGRIEKLYHKVVGEKIAIGEPIYDLYSRQFLLAQEEFLINKEIKLIDGNDISVSAKNKLLLWGMTPAQITELAQTKKTQVTLTVFSKVSGTITGIPVKEGENVEEGTTVYKLANLNSLWVEAQVYSNEFGLLKEGAKVEIIPEAFPEETMEGQITFSNPELENSSKINLIRVVVNNPGEKFSPGMQATVVLHSEEKKAITLPVDAVIRDANHSVVWVQNPKGGFESRMVETGTENKFRVEIKSGLTLGEIAVTSGTYLLNSEYIFKTGMMPTMDM